MEIFFKFVRLVIGWFLIAFIGSAIFIFFSNILFSQHFIYRNVFFFVFNYGLSLNVLFNIWASILNFPKWIKTLKQQFSIGKKESAAFEYSIKKTKCYLPKWILRKISKKIYHN